MNGYRHNVSGFFAKREPAENTLSHLIRRGLRLEQLCIVAVGTEASFATHPQAESNGVLKDILVNAAIGAIGGAVLGALVQGGLVLANEQLSAASPLLAPFMLMGAGAFLGAFLGSVIGATAGVGQHQGRFPVMVLDGITHRDIVLVAETHSEQETAIAQEVIAAFSYGLKDTNMAVLADSRLTTTDARGTDVRLPAPDALAQGRGRIPS
ncbi:hypothetical protein [Stutzerimonas kirkiae]|uniref:hypothetical protein n=1 Tax=Stutzerimonas kirkiae TaxID=2211392 RepID=UPI0015F2B866|nr:hypothetical protein [Stutzerimonas kirkiae]